MFSGDLSHSSNFSQTSATHKLTKHVVGHNSKMKMYLIIVMFNRDI